MVEMSEGGGMEEFEGTVSLLAAGGQDRPRPLAPASALRAAGALGDASVDHDVSQGLFGLYWFSVNWARAQFG